MTPSVAVSPTPPWIQQVCLSGLPSSLRLCLHCRAAAEQSSSEGIMVEDDMAFPDAQAPVKLVFGCESSETGMIYSQQADGIMGMGNNNNALQSQVSSLTVHGMWYSKLQRCRRT